MNSGRVGQSEQNWAFLPDESEQILTFSVYPCCSPNILSEIFEILSIHISHIFFFHLASPSIFRGRQPTCSSKYRSWPRDDVITTCKIRMCVDCISHMLQCHLMSAITYYNRVSDSLHSCLIYMNTLYKVNK